MFHTKNCQTKNLCVKIPKSLRQEIRRCTKKAHLLHLRIRLTQTPNLEILRLKIGCIVFIIIIVIHSISSSINVTSITSSINVI